MNRMLPASSGVLEGARVKYSMPDPELVKIMVFKAFPAPYP